MPKTPSFRLFFVLVLIVMASAPVACGGGNPLLGTWKIDEEASGPGAAMLGLVGADELVFEEEKMIVGPNVMDVTYEVDGDRVIVTNPQGVGTVYTIREDGRMSLDTPGGELVYGRS